MAGEDTATGTKATRGRPKKVRDGGATTIANVVKDIEEEIGAKRREADGEDPKVESGHPKPLPQPFKLTNPRVTKSPKLWPSLFDVLQASHADFVTARDLDGELTRAFNECIISFYLK